MMPAPPASDQYFDLGSFHRSISTNNADCQTWFNRGLVWVYGFNHNEGAQCFENAISHDKSCAIAYWGLAYASGPNYNKSWEIFDKADLKKSLEKTYRAAQDALDNMQGASPVEKALIRAVQSRYPRDSPTDDYASWNRAYADAMEKVYAEFGDDTDVAVLYADALMNLTPWQMWDIQTEKPAKGARTLEAKAVLEKALKDDGNWDNPGLLHMYIHLMEMSPTPEIALNPADRLRSLIPDAGHLRHMPSHLDILIGDYRRSIASNTEAIEADEKYLAQAGLNNFYTLYRSHDYHSLIYAAMFAGQSKVALDATTRMEKSLPESLLRVESPPMADWLETFLSTRPHVLIRFGRWEEILDLSIPDDQELYSVTTASIHYAKGVAYAATGRIQEAEKEQELLEAAARRVQPSRMDFPNKCSDVIAVSKAMLAGELEYRRGNIDKAFVHLAKSVELDDSLVYSEPWAWMQPTRHAYAALLLEQDQVEKAADLYRADLGLDKTLPRARQHPENVWALHGYMECLKRLGRKAEADLLDRSLTLALAVADVDVTSSCYCRKDTNGHVESDRKGKTNGTCC